MADTVVSYQCLNCHAPLKFIPGHDTVTCKHCSTEFPVATIEEFYKNKEKQASLADQARQKQWETKKAGGNWSDEELSILKTFTCSSCGAELSCDDNTMATECCYCGNPTMIPSRFNGMLKPDFIIPFKKTKDEAVESLSAFYKGKYLLPKTFTTKNRIANIQPMYVPYWLFDSSVKASAHFQATNENLIDTPDVLVKEKLFFDVHRDGQMNFTKIPVDGSSKMDDTWMESIEPFDYRELVPFSSAYLAGYLADKYDVSADDCAPNADKRLKNSVIGVFADTLQHYNDSELLECSVIKEQSKVSYAMVPVWILTTRYNNQPYTFLMNAQTGKMVGNLPIDKVKAFLYPLYALLATLPVLYFVLMQFIK